MALVIWQLCYNTKKEVERIIENAKEDDKNINAYDGVDLVFEKFHALLEEHGISIDKLII
jgi:molecular chaperone GrpE (heat shock protein)